MKINNYPNVTTLADTDLLLVETSIDGAYKNILVSDLKKIFGSSYSSGGGTQFPVTVRYRFSANNVILVAGSTTQINAVTDLSGNGFTGSPGNTNHPILDASAINNKPAITFNGSSWIDLGSAAIIPSTGDFVVFQILSQNGGFVPWSSGGSNWGFVPENNSLYVYTNGILSVLYPDLQNAGWKIAAWGRLGTELIVIIDGQKFTGPIDSSEIRGSINSFQSRTVIAAEWANLAQYFFVGSIAEMCVKHQPTISDVNAIGNYYASEFSLPWVTVS